MNFVPQIAALLIPIAAIARVDEQEHGTLTYEEIIRDFDHLASRTDLGKQREWDMALRLAKNADVVLPALLKRFRDSHHDRRYQGKIVGHFSNPASPSKLKPIILDDLRGLLPTLEGTEEERGLIQSGLNLIARFGKRKDDMEIIARFSDHERFWMWAQMNKEILEKRMAEEDDFIDGESSRTVDPPGGGAHGSSSMQTDSGWGAKGIWIALGTVALAIATFAIGRHTKARRNANRTVP